jgi:protein involved in polysaccharide export with SLBB domain
MLMGKPSRKSVNLLFVVLILIGLVAACSGPKPARTAIAMAQQPVLPYRVGPGDVIDIKLFYTPELDESQIVRPDGKMTLQLIGDIEAQGKTSEELQRELVHRFSTQLINPQVAVFVRRVHDSRYWVAGEVKRPGPYQMLGHATIMEAIMDAGGGTRPTADLKNVLVVRQRDGHHYGCLVNVKEILQGKEGPSFNLQARDIVFVPSTNITKANDWMDQYVNKILPQHSNLWFGYNINQQ